MRWCGPGVAFAVWHDGKAVAQLVARRAPGARTARRARRRLRRAHSRAVARRPRRCCAITGRAGTPGVGAHARRPAVRLTSTAATCATS